MNHERFKPHTYRGETPATRRPVEYTSAGVLAEHTPEQRRIREFIDSLDERVLQDILAFYFQKSGSDVATMNFIPFADISVIYDLSDRAGTHGLHGIRINAANEKSEAALLWTIIHEEVHAISENRTIEHTAEASTFDFKSGVRHAWGTYGINDAEAHERHTLLNEGLTELITDKIVQEYLKRTGGSLPHISQDDMHTIKDRAYSKFITDNYATYWHNVEFLITLCAQLAEVPEQVVEESFVRLYMRNGEVFSEELMSALAEVEQTLAAPVQEAVEAGIEKDMYELLVFMALEGLPQEKRAALHARIERTMREGMKIFSDK